MAASYPISPAEKRARCRHQQFLSADSPVTLPSLRNLTHVDEVRNLWEPQTQVSNSGSTEEAHDLVVLGLVVTKDLSKRSP